MLTTIHFIMVDKQYQEVIQYVFNSDGSIGKVRPFKRVVGEVRQIAMNRTDQRTRLASHCSLIGSYRPSNCTTRPLLG